MEKTSEKRIQREKIEEVKNLIEKQLGSVHNPEYIEGFLNSLEGKRLDLLLEITFTCATLMESNEVYALGKSLEDLSIKMVLNEKIKELLK